MYKAGVGLSDTTHHTGNYCIKFSPASGALFSTSPLTWTQSIPTENIQGKTMSIGVWINIPNAAFWAGTYNMPKLTVNYDNGTFITSDDVNQAACLKQTGWQYIQVSFTPATTYTQLIVSVTGMTDAITANGYFYAADMSVLYPAGHNIALGAMNSWANGEPLMPTISTTISAADMWAVSPTSFGSNTVGMLVKQDDLKLDDVETKVTAITSPLPW